MDIRILPSNVANIIAAGEVVQRPASVVKELMENSVDAGAGRIDVIVRDAGRTLIQVIDNGCGMNPDDAVLCFQRHATSKIAEARDLDSISTYGFRGEALASIAAVSEVELKTRTADADVATRVNISDATLLDPGRQDISQVAAPAGTSFAVRNIFYNTPARRKFLKSDASELKAIISEFIRMALSRCDLGFSLRADERDIYKLHPAKSLMYRIQDLFGSSCTDNMLPLEAATSIVKLSGLVCRPEAARKNAPNQFFFVNGRYFRSPYLHKAVMKAYESLIPDGSFPSYFIYLEMDPREMDVNVHPTKTEIKFEDDNLLFNIIMAAVREALGRSGVKDFLDFDGGNMPQVPSVGSPFEQFRPAAEPRYNSDDSFNPFEKDGFPNQNDWSSSGYAAHPSLKKEDFSKLFDTDLPKQEASSPGVLLFGGYILKAVPAGIFVCDAARAMERVLYERFLNAFSSEASVGAKMLFPLEVEIGAENIPVVTANAALLSRLGFELSPFGKGSVVVNAIPEGIKNDSMTVSALVWECVTALSDETASVAGSVYAPLAGKLAASSSRGAILPSDADAASALVEALNKCENPGQTASGRRVFTILSDDDLFKMLK